MPAIESGRSGSAPQASLIGYGNLAGGILRGLLSDPPAAYQLTGLQGMGKSAVLRYLALEAESSRHAGGAGSVAHQQERIFAVSVSFRQMPEDSDPFEYLYDEVYQEYVAFRTKTRTAQDGKGLQVTEKPEYPVLELDHLVKQLVRERVRVWLLLDDFDVAVRRLKKQPGAADGSEAVTRLRPFKDRVGMVLTSRVPLSSLITSGDGSNFLQVIPAKYLSGLISDEVTRLLMHVTGAAQVDPNDQELVRKYADGHPYLSTLIYGLIREARDILVRPEGALSYEEKVFVRSFLADALKDTLKQIYWDGLEDIRQPLTELVKAEGPLPDSLKSELTVPIRLGLVRLVDGKYRLFSPLFKSRVCQLSNIPEGDEAEEEVTPQADSVGSTHMSSREKEFYELLKAAGQTGCTFKVLWERVWQEAYPSEVGSDSWKAANARIQVYISRVRRFVRDHYGEDILSLRGTGYTLIPASESAFMPNLQSPVFGGGDAVGPKSGALS